MTDNRNPKRFKDLRSWFKKDILPNISESENHDNGNESEAEIINEDIENDQHKNIEIEKDQREQIVNEGIQGYDISSLERDPGKRHPIGMYPLNERDNVRRAYVVHGPYQPHLDNYPSTHCGNQGRKFNHRWYKMWPWLEYSTAKDKAYCFPCFLFDEYPSRHPSFTEIGFNGWKNVMSKHSGVVYHVGGIMSTHNASMRKLENLKNPSNHIERVINTLSLQEIARNRLQLVATIEAVRLLARQGCSFRGRDESVDSLNSGNFNAVLSSYKRINDEVNKVFDKAPGNAKYTSPPIYSKANYKYSC